MDDIARDYRQDFYRRLVDRFLSYSRRWLHSRIAVLLAALGGAHSSVPVTADLTKVDGAVFELEFCYQYFHSQVTLPSCGQLGLGEDVGNYTL
jgi:hypothetical protein